MDDRTFIAEVDTVERVTPLPVRRDTPRPSLPTRELQTALERQEQYAALLPYGTTVSPSWTDTWVTYVSEVERQQQYAICGARRSDADIDSLIRAGKVDPEAATHDPLTAVCTHKAGLRTAHPGEGRCYKHGGNSSPTAKFSLLSQSSLSKQVREFFESEELLDLRGAIATTWAAADAIQRNAEDEGGMNTTAAKEIGALMSRIGNLTKQHNEIMEKRKISIEVPEFIAWAEHFYELAVKYILDGEKDVRGFLQEAQSYYNATVTLKVGIDNSGDGHRAGNPFSGDQASEVLGSGSSES